MNCASIEGLIALHVEDDLSEPQRIFVESHLQGCAACRALTDDLRSSQTVLKELRLGVVHSTVLAEVRQRVLNEVGDMRPAPAWMLAMHRRIFSGLRHKAAIAGIALALLVSGSVWYGHARGVGERGINLTIAVAQITAPTSIPAVPIHQLPTSGARIVKRVKPLETSITTPAEVALESQISQVPMKFVTDDPDIIIYWLPNDKGGRK